MKAKFKFMDQYYMFIKDNQYYMVDMGYLAWLVTLFLPLCYFIKYPVYEISKQDFMKMEEFVNKIYSKGNNKKINMKLVLTVIPLANICLLINIQTSIFKAFIITLLIILISYFFVKKNQMKLMRLLGCEYDAYFPSYMKTSKKIVFKFNKRQSFINLGAIYCLQILIFGCSYGLFHSLISDGEANLFYAMLAGLTFEMIIRVSPAACVNKLTAEMKD